MSFLQTFGIVLSLIVGITPVLMGLWLIYIWRRAKLPKHIVVMKPHVFAIAGVLFIGAGIASWVQFLGYEIAPQWITPGRWGSAILLAMGMAMLLVVPFLFGWARLSTETPVMRRWEISYALVWLVLCTYFLLTLGMNSGELKVIWVVFLTGIAFLIRHQAIQRARKESLPEEST